MFTNNQETPSPFPQYMRSTQAGRPHSDVWKHFSKIQVKNSNSHYKPQKLLAHLANHCISCDSQTRKNCLEELNNKTKANLQKNLNVSGQTNISSFYEIIALTKESYQPPSIKLSSQGLLDIKVGIVNQKINSILEKAGI
ncbi:6268_t:CDS:2 [Entrophospora sp. SA101]|nr:8011_t:CDS:2 [Entrophospora sp. SA101]CAJ0908632.1 6268_t:CDS:2 [Entrophospora sp. SA101]